MTKSKTKALRAMLEGRNHQLSPRKHPILSGAVKIVSYAPPAWRYGCAKG